MVYDVIIVGGGPAGLTAGVYARTRKLSTLILEAQATGGQLEWLYPTKSVYDYPSYIAIEGGELAQLFVLHSRESGAEIRPEEVVDVQRQASGFKLATRQGSAYEGRSIILAMGMGLLEPKRLGVPGEAEFESNGVEYRVRDRREFKGKRVVVVGGGDSALEIALEIVAAAKKVILVHRREEFRAMEKNVEAVMESPIQVLFNAEVTSLEGDGKVERAVVYDNRTLKKNVLDIDAVIVKIGFEPKTTSLPPCPRAREPPCRRRWRIPSDGRPAPMPPSGSGPARASCAARNPRRGRGRRTGAGRWPGGLRRTCRGVCYSRSRAPMPRAGRVPRGPRGRRACRRERTRPRPAGT